LNGLTLLRGRRSEWGAVEIRGEEKVGCGCWEITAKRITMFGQNRGIRLNGGKKRVEGGRTKS